MKRVLAMFLAALMLATVFPAAAFAEDEAVEFTVSISAANEKNTVGANATPGNAGKTFTANVEVTSGESRIKSFGYVWGRDWAKILNETSQSYTPGNDELQYINVRVWVTAYDENGNALKTVDTYLQGQAFQRMSKKSKINVTPDGKDVFYVGGKKFTLLDDKMLSVNNAVTEEFYVLADDAYGSRVFDTGLSDLAVATFYPGELTAGNIKSSGEGNIAYWLNNEFISDSYTGEKLPAEIINNLSEHEYFTSQNSEYQNKSSVLKVALLGRVDYNKYLSKISPIMNGKTDEDYWWLRDVQGIVSAGNGKFGPFLVMPKWDGTEGVNNASKEGYIRPAFYLGKDFFKTVHLDINTLGDNIKTLLLNKYTDEELLGVYSQAELNVLKNGKAIISSVTLSESKDALLLGTEENNYSITATPALSAGQADGFKYQWYQGNVKLKNETNQTLIIGNDNAHYKTFKVEVTPVDSEGNAVGEPFMSESKYYNIPLQRLVRRKIASSQEDIRFNSDDKYMFELDGKKFLVLDEFDSATESFYVLADDLYGKHVFDTNVAANESVLFSIEKTYTRGDETVTVSSGEGNIAYWLNNDFLENGNGEGNALPEGIKNNLAEHIYATAQSSKWVERTETHKVGLLGRADFQKYSDKIGVLGNDQWWLRDVQGILRANDGGDKQLGPIAVMAEWNVLQGSKQDAEKYIRPAFYLKEDFFKTVKLNVNKIGAKLRKMIIARYTDEELKAAGYSDIEIETLKSAFGVEITTSADGYNFFNHENAKVNLEILNETATPRTVSIEYTAEPLIGGSLVSDSKETAVPSGKSNQTVDLTALPNGRYNITFILKENGEEFYRHSEVFNITENVSAASDRVLSLGASSVRTEKDMEILKNLGLDKARMVITWDSIETSKTGKGNYDFSGTDAYMAAAEKYGLKITAILAYGNTLYGTQTDKHALTGEAKTAFVNFVKEAVKRYPNVNSFEIWNEPNAVGFWNGDTADYITLAKETVAAIREINNDVKIYVGSIDVSQSNATNFADSLLKEKMDVNGISYHPYFHEGMNKHYGTVETHLTGKINTYNQIVLNNGGWVKLPATEIGYETHLGSVEKATWAQAARETVKALITLQSANETDIDIYCLRDTSHEFNSFGMMNSTYEPTDILFGVNHYAAELGDAVYVAPINTGDSKLFGHLYIKSDKTPIAVMYAAVGQSEKSYSFGGSVTYEDFYGNNAQTAETVTIGENPVYIKGLTADNVKEIIKAELASKYSGYSSEVVPDYRSVESNAASIKALLDSHYKNGFKLINGLTDENEKFAALYKWNSIGEIIAKYYALFAADEYVGAQSRAKAYISGSHNYYANAIARYALDYADSAERFNESGNAGFAAAYEALAQTLMSYANYFDGSLTDAAVKETDGGLRIKLFANGENVSASYYLGMYNESGALVNSMNIPFNNKSALDSAVQSLTLDKSQYSKIKLFGFGENLKPLNGGLEIK